MEQREGQAAAVIMLRGHGEERLRQAIQQGLVRKELEEDFREVLQKIEGLKADNKFAHDEISKLQKEIGNYKEVYFRAMRAKQREEERKKRWENTKILAVGIGVIFLIVFACMFLCRLIFG